MPFFRHNKRGDIPDQKNQECNPRSAENRLSRISTNDGHAPRYKRDMREGRTPWEKQHGSLLAPTGKEMARAWIKGSFKSVKRFMKRILLRHTEQEYQDVSGLDRAASKVLDANPNLGISQGPSINRNVTICDTDSLRPESTLSSLSNDQRFSTDTVLHLGLRPQHNASSSSDVSMPYSVRRTRLYRFQLPSELNGPGLTTVSEGVPAPIQSYVSALIDRDDTRSSSCRGLISSSTVAFSSVNLPATPPNASASASTSASTASVHIFDPEAYRPRMSLPSTASDRSEASEFNRHEEVEPIQLLARNQFDDELSSLSSGDDLSTLANASYSRTTKTVKKPRQPQLKSAPTLPEPERAESFSSNGARISNGRGGGWALESLIDSAFFGNRQSDSSSPFLADVTLPFRFKANTSGPSDYQVESTPPEAFLSMASTPLKETLTLAENVASKETLPITDGDPSIATRLETLSTNPCSLGIASSRPAKRLRVESLCDSDSRRTPSLLSSYTTTRCTTVSTPRTSACDSSLEFLPEPFDVLRPANMLYKSRRSNAVVDIDHFRRHRTRPRLALQIPETATHKATADNTGNSGSAKEDEKHLLSLGRGPPTFFDQLRRSLSNGRSWREHARRSAERPVTSAVSDEKEESGSENSPLEGSPF